MKKAKRVLALCFAVILTMGLGVSALAASNDTEARVRPAKSAVTDSAREKRSSARVSIIEVAASVLGITKEEVKESVKNGKVGDLLVAANKVDAFKTAYLAKTKEKLDAAVTAGTMTQADADTKYAEVEAKMAAYDGTTHLCESGDHSKMNEKMR